MTEAETKSRGHRAARVLTAIATCAVAVAGCGTFVYEPAKGADLATVRVVNESGRHLRVLESQKGDCRDMWRLGNDETSDFIPPGRSTVTKAKPGALFVFNAAGGAGVGVGSGSAGSFSVSSCFLTVGLVPEPHGVYEIAYQTVKDGCTLTAIRRDIAEPKAVPLIKMKLNNLIGPQSCERAASS
jgi:hypothetical protein